MSFWARQVLKELHGTNTPFIKGELEILDARLEMNTADDRSRVIEILEHKIKTRHYQIAQLQEAIELLKAEGVRS